MVAATIPNLWPVEALKDVVLSPEEILQVQAQHLQQSSRGLIEAEVIKTITKNYIEFRLDIVAPLLNNYRQTILEFSAGAERLYPIIVTQAIQDDDLLPANSGTVEVIRKALRATASLTPFPSGVIDEVLGVEESKPVSPPPRILYSESDFLVWLEEVLRSPQVIAVIQSLLARIQAEGKKTVQQEK